MLKNYRNFIINILLFSSVLIGLNSIYSYVSLKNYLENKISNDIAIFSMGTSQLKQIADITFHNIINTKEVIDIFKNAHKANDEEKQKIRDKLYLKLKDNYMVLRNNYVRQLHFHLPNNESFLRFHRPKVFGDDLTEVRKTVAFVNQTKKQVFGFEEGRIFNGFRYVYPLFDEKNIHIGSVEISFSLLSFKKFFEKNYANDGVDFVIQKDVVQKKVFKDELKNYVSYGINDEYVIQKDFIDYNKDSNSCLYSYDIVQNLKNDKDIKYKMKLKEAFTVFFMDDADFDIVSFIPISNPITKEYPAYMIHDAKSNYLHIFFTQFIIQTVISIFLAFIVAYLLYRFQKSKNQTEKIMSRYKAILDNSINMIALIKDGKIIQSNPALLNFFNLETTDEAKKIYDFIIKKDGFFYPQNRVKWLEELLRLEDDKRVVLVDDIKNQTRKIFQIFLSKIEKEKNTYIIILNDITQIKMENLTLEQKAHSDELTKLLNRHAFNIILKEKYELSVKYGLRFSIIMFDVDYFKQINDTFGHQVGDKVLVYLSKIVRNKTRIDDFICRWGGEEFLLLVNTNIKQAENIAENIRSIIETDSKKSKDIPAFTCSFGVVSLDGHNSVDDVLRNVDKMMYLAKKSGRNIVMTKKDI